MGPVNALAKVGAAAAAAAVTLTIVWSMTALAYPAVQAPTHLAAATAACAR